MAGSEKYSYIIIKWYYIRYYFFSVEINQIIFASIEFTSG